MPVTMSFSPSPRRGTATGIESGNKLGSRPVVRQSKLYREHESGNTMKSLFGQDHLSWKTQEQEGVFNGQGVYDASNNRPSSPPVLQSTGGATHDFDDAVCQEVEYPQPGSVASCDACESVVNRYYHCLDCPETTGLFDLCSECCVSAERLERCTSSSARASPAAHLVVAHCSPLSMHSGCCLPEAGHASRAGARPDANTSDTPLRIASHGACGSAQQRLRGESLICMRTESEMCG